jgi:hypothetical protein
MKPAWLLPIVFSGMTIAVTTLIECRSRLVAATGAAMLGGGAALQALAPHPMAERHAAHDAGIDLRAELLAALSDARRQARGPGAYVEVEVPEGLTLSVQPTSLRPVLLALLRNAIQHAPGGTVFVGAIRADAELRIVIIDDGPVVAEPLTGDARTSLARLLALSDASLLVDHRPGDGTTVMLCLPDRG